MYCVRCGAQSQESQSFCPACGTPARGNTPLMPRAGRLAGHIRLLGILWMAISAFRLVPGLFMVLLFHEGAVWMPPGLPGFVYCLLRCIGTLLIVGALLGLLAGMGLLQRQPWGRLLAIVLAFVGLVDLPLGAALGIYTLWVLLPAQSEQEYRQLASDA
jgi:zinc-ribbon domain